MCLDNFVGKEIVLNGKKGIVKRKDARSADIIIVKLEEGGTQGINVNDYNYTVEDNVVVMNLKSVSNPPPGPDACEEPCETGTKGGGGTMTPKPASDDWPVPSEDNRIYHSTSLQNMISIIKKNGIFSRWQLLQMGFKFKDTAHPKIIDWRKKLEIENMIPFHFKSKTPYEYAVFTDNEVDKENKTVPSEDMVVITINKHKYDYCSFIFTAHPLSNNAVKFHADNAIVPNLKFWTTLDKYKDYNPMSDGVEKQICMAEYDVGLSYIPLDDILEIYVQTQEKVDMLLAADKRGILKGKIIVGDKKYLIKKKHLRKDIYD